MARLGMDVDEVERVAGTLHQQSTQLTTAMNQIGQAVQQAVHAWEGQDSRHFHEEWNGNYRPALQKIAQAIEELSRKARQNAQAQRDVSSR